MKKLIRVLQEDKPQACRGGHAISGAVAMACPLPDCEEQFPLKKRGDISTFESWRYQDHLRVIHNIFLPRAIPVLESRKAGK